MAQPYVGEIRVFAGNFAPVGWAFCDGQLLSISENETLFNLIGTTYGGDGQSTFALPDLRGRFALHAGTGPGLSNRALAETGGAPNFTGTAPGATVDFSVSRGLSVGAGHSAALYTNDTRLGGDRMLGLSCIISLYGIYPSQT